MEGGGSAAGALVPPHPGSDTEDTEDASHTQEGNAGEAVMQGMDEDTETEDEGGPIYAILAAASRGGGSTSSAVSGPPVKKKAGRKAKAEGGGGDAGEGGSGAAPKKRASGGGRKKKAAQEDVAEGDEKAAAAGGKKRRSTANDDSSTVGSGKARRSRGKPSLGPVAVRAAEGEATLLERCLREAMLDSSVLELPDVQALARVCRGLREVVRGATVGLKGGPAVLRVANSYPRLGRLTIVLDELDEEAGRGGWRVPSELEDGVAPKRLTHVSLRVKHDTHVYPPERPMHFGRDFRLDEELVDLTESDGEEGIALTSRPPKMVTTVPALSAQWERGFEDARRRAGDDKGKGKKAAGRNVRQLGTDTRVIEDPLEALSPLSRVPVSSLTLGLQLASERSVLSFHASFSSVLRPWSPTLTSLTLQTLYPLTPLHSLTCCLAADLLPQLVHLEIGASDTRDDACLKRAGTQRRFFDALASHAPHLRTLKLGKIGPVRQGLPSSLVHPTRFTAPATWEVFQVAGRAQVLAIESLVLHEGKDQRSTGTLLFASSVRAMAADLDTSAHVRTRLLGDNVLSVLLEHLSSTAAGGGAHRLAHLLTLQALAAALHLAGADSLLFRADRVHCLATLRTHALALLSSTQTALAQHNTGGTGEAYLPQSVDACLSLVHAMPSSVALSDTLLRSAEDKVGLARLACWVLSHDTPDRSSEEPSRAPRVPLTTDLLQKASDGLGALIAESSLGASVWMEGVLEEGLCPLLSLLLAKCTPIFLARHSLNSDRGRRALPGALASLLSRLVEDDLSRFLWFQSHHILPQVVELSLRVARSTCLRFCQLSVEVAGLLCDVLLRRVSVPGLPYHCFDRTMLDKLLLTPFTTLKRADPQLQLASVNGGRDALMEALMCPSRIGHLWKALVEGWVKPGRSLTELLLKAAGARGLLPTLPRVPDLAKPLDPLRSATQDGEWWLGVVSALWGGPRPYFLDTAMRLITRMEKSRQQEEKRKASPAKPKDPEPSKPPRRRIGYPASARAFRAAFISEPKVSNDLPAMAKGTTVLFEEMMVAASLTLPSGPLALLSDAPDAVASASSSKAAAAPGVEVEVEAGVEVEVEEEGAAVREVTMALVGQLRGDLLKLLDYALRFMTYNGKMKVGSSNAGWSRAKLRVWGRCVIFIIRTAPEFLILLQQEEYESLLRWWVDAVAYTSEATLTQSLALACRDDGVLSEVLGLRFSAHASIARLSKVLAKLTGHSPSIGDDDETAEGDAEEGMGSQSEAHDSDDGEEEQEREEEADGAHVGPPAIRISPATVLDLLRVREGEGKDGGGEGGAEEVVKGGNEGQTGEGMKGGNEGEGEEGKDGGSEGGGEEGKQGGNEGQTGDGKEGEEGKQGGDQGQEADRGEGQPTVEPGEFLHDPGSTYLVLRLFECAPFSSMLRQPVECRRLVRLLIRFEEAQKTTRLSSFFIKAAQEVLETLPVGEMLQLVSVQGLETLRQYPIIKQLVSTHPSRILPYLLQTTTPEGTAVVAEALGYDVAFGSMCIEDHLDALLAYMVRATTEGRGHTALDLLTRTLSVAPDLPRRLKLLFATSPEAVSQLRLLVNRFETDRRSDRAGNREALSAFEAVLKHEEGGEEEEEGEGQRQPFLGENGMVSFSRAGRRRKRVRRFGEGWWGEELEEGGVEDESEEERGERKRKRRVVALESEEEEGGEGQEEEEEEEEQEEEEEEYEAEAVSDGEDEHMA